MKMFTMVKEIRSKCGELHFQRYAIVETKWFGLYIHKIHKADKDLHLHSHPWNFKTIVLSGSYLERYLGKNQFNVPREFTRRRGVLSYASGDRNYYHKILEIVRGPVTTLFFTYGQHDPWSYNVDGVKVESELYRTQKHAGKFN